MKSLLARTLTLALVAGSLLAGPAAFADPRFEDHGRVERGHEHRGYEHRGYEHRGYEHRGYEHGWARERDWQRPYAYGYRGRYEPHYWRRGEFLPAGHFGRGAWVSSYWLFGLREPPPGCVWVRVGGDFVLTALATGLVIDVVAD